MNNDFVAGKVPIIVCPKFEDVQANYAKLVEIFSLNDIKEVAVLHMEVPCCGGLSRMIAQALLTAKKDVPLRNYEIGVKGNIKKVY